MCFDVNILSLSWSFLVVLVPPIQSCSGQPCEIHRRLCLYSSVSSDLKCRSHDTGLKELTFKTLDKQKDEKNTEAGT